jgi:hypothetical protein
MLPYKKRKRPPTYQAFLEFQMLMFGITPKDVRIRRTIGSLELNKRIKVGWEGKGYNRDGELVLQFWEDSFELACIEIVRQCVELGLKPVA